MDAKASSNSKPRIPSVRTMTPEKFEALSPAMKRAYLKKSKERMDAMEKRGAKKKAARIKATRTAEYKMTKADIQEMKAFDREVERENAAKHERLAFGIAELVAQNPRIEWEIVHNFLRRNNQALVSR